MTNKAVLRALYLQKRKDIGPEELEGYSKAIASQFKSFFQSHPAKSVHVFLPIRKQNEINTWHIVNLLKDLKVNVIVPRSDFATTSMAHVKLEEGTRIEENRWGIPEPVNGQTVPPDEIGMALVPLVVCDRQGYRVGYGKGFYDKFLSASSPGVVKVGISIFPPVTKISFDPHDVRLNYCIDPDQIHHF